MNFGNQSQNDILKRIITLKESLPNKQKKLCNYIIEHYQEFGLLTVKELANQANVGTTTVMRVLKALQIDSFNDLKRELHQKSVQSTWWHLKKSFSTNIRENNLQEVWNELMNILNSTLNDDLIENFEKTISLMVNASKINILGLRSSKVAAKYFGYMLEEFSNKIKQLSSDSDFLYDRLLLCESNEVLVIFAHSPYSVQIIEAAQFSYERKIPIILITDLLSCPITPYAATVLNIKSSDKQYSIVPTIALIEALVIEYGRHTSNSSIQHLDDLGQLLKEKNITTS